MHSKKATKHLSDIYTHLKLQLLFFLEIGQKWISKKKCLSDKYKLAIAMSQSRFWQTAYWLLEIKKKEKKKGKDALIIQFWPKQIDQ